MAKEVKRIVPFNDILDALLDHERPFPAAFAHRLSDLPAADLRELKRIWSQISADRRAALMEDLETLAEADALLIFTEIAIMSLADPDPRVRQVAVRMLWENQEVSLIPKFIDILKNDDQEIVRAAAATSLGYFVYLGEVEEISPEFTRQVEEALLATLQSNEEINVQRHSLESLGYSSRPEVKPLIRKAYNSQDNRWLCSALYAMGRSADQVWGPSVSEMLDHSDPEVQFEAVRAAGELEISAARPILFDMLDSGLDDEETRMAAIWSLSQIGGEGVRDKLQTYLDESEDESEMDFIEEALDNLYLTDGFDKFVMFDFDLQDEDDLDTVINLEDEDERNNENLAS